MHILDTDPRPVFEFQNTSASRLLSGIREYANCEELSDITFLVEGKTFYAHKIVLCLLR